MSNVSSPSKPKTDLYVWREIFSLWVEAQVFESRRERDRGDRDTAEIEKKLDWFVAQVAARKLANKMKHKESRTALEEVRHNCRSCQSRLSIALTHVLSL